MGRVKCAGCGGELVLPFKTEPDGMYWHNELSCYGKKSPALTPSPPEAKGNHNDRGPA